jgi:hypothetical protein
MHLGSAIVWTLTAIADAFSSRHNLQTDILKIAFALIPALYTVVPFLMIRRIKDYKGTPLLIDSLQTIFIFGIYYSLGLVSQEHHDSPNLYWVYGFIAAIAVSSLNYRAATGFKEWAPRLVIIPFLLFLSVSGCGLLIIRRDLVWQWAVYMPMLITVSVYLYRTVKDLDSMPADPAAAIPLDQKSQGKPDLSSTATPSKSSTPNTPSA